MNEGVSVQSSSILLLACANTRFLKAVLFVSVIDRKKKERSSRVAQDMSNSIDGCTITFLGGSFCRVFSLNGWTMTNQ